MCNIFIGAGQSLPLDKAEFILSAKLSSPSSVHSFVFTVTVIVISIYQSIYQTLSNKSKKRVSQNVKQFFWSFWKHPVFHIFTASHRKTSDIPEYHREEAELVVPSYGYFIRGAQTTFSGVLRLVQTAQQLQIPCGSSFYLPPKLPKFSHGWAGRKAKCHEAKGTWIYGQTKQKRNNKMQ